MRQQSILDTITERNYAEIKQGFTAQQAETVKEDRAHKKGINLEMDLEMRL